MAPRWPGRCAVSRFTASGVGSRVLRRREGLECREDLRSLVGFPGVSGGAVPPGESGGDAARSGLREGAKRRSPGDAVAHCPGQLGRGGGGAGTYGPRFSASSRFMR